MIVRILGDGQYEVDQETVARLEKLDLTLGAALEARDQAAFDSALEALQGEIHRHGSKLEVDDLRPSELTLPQQGATVDEVHDLLTSEGKEGE